MKKMMKKMNIEEEDEEDGMRKMEYWNAKLARNKDVPKV